MTDRPVPWNKVFHYLADLAEAKPNAADYATTVRTLYEVLVKEGVGPEDARDFLRFHVPAQHERGLISKQHRNLALKLLPKPVGRARGRPPGALGEKAYKEQYELLGDWIYENTLDPFLTKEQFEKKHLGITEEQYTGQDSEYFWYRVKALDQKFRQARMTKLDEGQRRALEIIYPLLVKFPQRLARQWREAKESSPALSQQDFLQEFFGWVKHFGVRTKSELHPIEAEMIDEYVQKINEGEKLLASSERG